MNSSRTHQAYLDYLQEMREEEGPRPTAFGTPGRGSMAGQCSRQIGFTILDVEESDPITETTLLAFHIGTALHSMVQAAMQEVWAMRLETPIDLRPLGYPISGHADGVYIDSVSDPEHGITVVWELKSKTGYGFKLARNSGHPEKNDIAQVAMYSLGVPFATSIHLVYVAKESSYGKNAIKAGDTIEWILNLDEPVPGQDGMTPRQIGSAEATRITAIASETLKDGMLPERFIPDYGVVDFVPAPESRDDHWRCRYCTFNALCATLRPGQQYLKDIILRRKGTNERLTETL